MDWIKGVSADGMRYKYLRCWLPLGKGMAIGRSRILVSDELHGHALDRTLRHEEQHLRQYRSVGLFWPLVYAWLWVRAGCSYRRHPWEIEARRVAWGDPDRVDYLP